MDTKISIWHKSNIPNQIFENLVNGQDELSLPMIGEIHVENPSIHNFSGPPPYDVLILIVTFFADIIRDGIIYDALKSILTYLFRHIYIQKISTAKQNSINDNQIQVVLMDGDKAIRIVFDANIPSEKIELVFDRAIEFIDSDRLVRTFSDARFVTKDKGQTIELEYNKDKDCWEPFDFENARREREEMISKIMRNIKH